MREALNETMQRHRAQRPRRHALRHCAKRDESNVIPRVHGAVAFKSTAVAEVSTRLVPSERMVMYRVTCFAIAFSVAVSGCRSPSSDTSAPSAAADTPKEGGGLSGGEGEAGAMDPTEILYAYAESVGADEVMVDDTDIFWSNGANLFAAPKNGSGPVRTMGPTGMWHATLQLAQDKEHVYWVQESNVVQTHKHTNVSRSIPFGEFDPLGGAIAVYGDIAYVADVGCHHLSRVNLIESTADVVKLNSPGVQGLGGNLAITEHAQFCSGGENGQVLRRDATTGEVKRVVQTEPGKRGVVAITVVDNTLFWVEVPLLLSETEQALYSIAQDGSGTPTHLETSEGNVTSRLLAKGQTLYWVGAGLQRFDLQTNEHRRLTQNAGWRADLALDSDYAYWVWPGYVYRVALSELEKDRDVLPNGRPLP